jgi:peptide deformylase
MALLPIRLFGDPVLRQRAADVTDFDEALRKLADDMHETMRHGEGAGLAANQVGVLKRLFTWEVVDTAEGETEPEGGAVVNPEVVELSEATQEGDEGCLSFPGLFYPTERPLRARVRAQDVHGEPYETEREGLIARVFLHELDHLDGILFIDHLAKHDRKEAMRRIRAGELEHPPAREHTHASAGAGADGGESPPAA